MTFTPEEFPQLTIRNPRLWWPVNKGPQNLYELKLTVSVKGAVCDSVKTRFGIRDITSDTNTPDKSRVFYVNGKRILSVVQTGFLRECYELRMNVPMLS